MKILINTPDINILGGVANHYKGLKPYWSEHVNYNFIGGRRGLPGYIVLPFDLFVFFFKLLFGSYDVVLLNPSLGNTALKRDALFLKVASWFNVKKIVFFHGWEDDLAEEVTKSPKWFTKNYGEADAFLVLADAFKKQMQTWGIAKPIYLTTTKVDDSLVESFKVNDKQFNNTLLFLARVEENKGIFVALDALKILPEFKELVSPYVDSKHPRIKFLGFRDDVAELIKDCDVGLLCTYTEGISNAIIELMANGVPVITNDISGGSKEIIRSHEDGFVCKDEDMLPNLEVLLGSEEIKNEIGEKASIKISKILSLEQMVFNYKQLYI